MPSHHFKLTKLPMRFLLSFLILIAILLQPHTSISEVPVSTPTPSQLAKKKYDLVLIHGLTNIHKWSDSFLETCLKIWGSGHVFVVYSSAETSVVTRNINGKILIVGGNEDKAGIDPINKHRQCYKSHTNITGWIRVAGTIFYHSPQYGRTGCSAVYLQKPNHGIWSCNPWHLIRDLNWQSLFNGLDFSLILQKLSKT